MVDFRKRSPEMEGYQALEYQPVHGKHTIMGARERVRRYLFDHFIHDMVDDDLGDDDSFLDQGILDSTGVLELVTFLEETFDIIIEDEELVPENLDSVANLVAFIQRKHFGGEGY